MTVELTGVNVLVVDDHEDARELLKTALTQYGAEVVTASSASEAYTLITATPTQWRTRCDGDRHRNAW